MTLTPTLSSSQPASPVVRVSKAHAYLQCSRSHLFALIRRGELTPVNLGGRASGLLIADLDAWLQRQRGVSSR